MDPDRLRSKAAEWVEEGLITGEQADAILARYEGTTHSRLTLALVAIHALSLALVLATVAAGYHTRQSAFVNLAALALFVQLLLVSGAEIPDTGAFALVAVGLALLAVGLDRGRRRLLDGMAGGEGRTG
ncbi:hypothetical protein [Natronorarus salvus]|uniref:hypothetical protein n=1 Tax=Natronorarus salvus TaxID=3117733 RepID=UPI002F268681